MIKFTLKFDAAAFREAAYKGWQRTMRPVFIDIGNRMRALMRGPKSGRLYGTHRASAPGEAPAVLRSTLINSIGSPTFGGTKGVIRLVVSDKKARLLDPQEGDPVNTRVAPRPFVQPAIEGAVAQANQGGIVRGVL